MMKSYRIARLAVITALMLAVSTSAFAIDEWYKALPLLGSLGQIKKDSALTIQDPVFFDPTLKPNQTTYSIRNYLNFKFDEASGVLLPDSFTVTVYVKLYLTVLSANGSTFMDSASFSNYPLTLRYFKGGRSWNMADMNFQSAVRVKAVVQSVVTSAGATFNAIAGALMLESEMRVAREYNFNCTTNVITTVSTDPSLIASKGELRVSWPKDRMANEYDLEWAYIDSTALGSYSTAGSIDPKKIFVNNATRVSISKEEYNIPLLYDNPGVLFYRVRPVQIKYSGQRVEAKWSSEVAASGLGQYSYASGHEPYLNWQATTSFAEEGKRKSVVQYYDGSLRSRQTVTKDNTTDTAIVAETMYDYQGRPVVQVMPSPSLSAMIKYTPNFNTDINNAEYDKTKYDDVLTGANGCGTGAAAMSSQAGAANYYSPNNPNKNNRYNKYIPDAKNYPFAETQYMADNTGRISKQGGVGFDMQIGRTDTVYNDSHETRYYYGSADQEDLNALFGTDAGNASHYFKNMVRDANGQYSVSYVDMHGRTIATALAGKPKAYLDSVKSSRVTSITKRLIDSVNNIKKGTLIESSKSLIVTFPAIDTFKYRLNADSIRLSTCTGSGQICYDCLYDLTITITDDCGNQFNNGSPFTYAKSNFTIGNLDTTCNKPTGFVDSFALFLPVGNYLVTKRLSVSKYGMDYYRDSVFMVKNTCKTLDDFIQQQRQLVYSQLSCAPTCQRCSIDTFRTWNLFRPYYLNQIGIAVTDTASYTAIAMAAYNRQLKECDELCGNTTVAAGIRRQMLADITPPYGQYANPNAIDENSIFYPSTLVPGRPRFADIQTYFDQNGKPDQITTATGTDIPQNASISDFTDNFKDSWADSLVTRHPEYCKLKTYESSPAFSGSNLFDQQFAAITTYKQAKAAGYLNPLGYADVIAQPSTVVKDPFFDGSVNPTYAATWRSVLNDSMRLRVKYSGSTYLDIWSLATAMAQCDSGSNSCYAHYSGNQYPFDIDTSCAGSLDMAWRFFREMYLAKKREIINKILGQACNAQININTATHTLNFPDQVTAMQKVPVSTTNITDSINSLVSNSCRSYVTQWWNELAPCNYTSADTAYLFPRLIKICTEGGDMNHPFGSSTTKPSSTYHYHSFAELIQAYNDSLHAAGDPRNLTPGQCNAYLLSAPAPYDNRPASSNQELWTKPDSCQCTTINTLYRQYQSAGASDASFAAYLLRVAGTTISNSTLDSLRGLCNGTLTCRYLSSPIIVPPVLQCGVKDVCADCSMVGNAYTKFQTAFPGITPTYASTDSIQRANNILFERFMNASLGFSKQAVDYLTFMDSCGGTSAATKCDTLSNILNGYRNRYLGYGNPDTMHFAVYPTGPEIPILTNRYAEIFGNGYAHITHAMVNGTPYQNSGLAIKKYDTLCVNNAFTIEAKLKGDSSDMLGGRYCRTLNFVFWDANGNAFSPTFQGIGAPSFATCGAGTWNITGGNNVSTWDTTNLSMYYRNQLDWYRIKMVVKNYQVKVYANDTLLTTIPYSMPISKITKWAFGLGCGYVDYVKVWDSTGVLQYSEEFEDCRQSASNYPAALTCASDCQASFTSYFNQQKGTNYSYTQIDSLYNTCNVKLTPCSDTLASKLSYLKNEFINNYYNHGRRYDANGCDTMTWKVDYGPLINQTGVPHNRIFHDGVMQFPDTLGKAPNPGRADYDFEFADSACVQGKFAIEFRIKDPINPLSSNHRFFMEFYSLFKPGIAKKFYLTFNRLADPGNSISYIDYLVAEYNRGYSSVSEFRQDFSYWRTVKFEMIDSVVNYYVDGQKLRTFNFPQGVSMPKIYGVGFSSQGDKHLSAAFDWIKMYDGNGQIFYQEDFNDCGNFAFFSPYIECPKPSCSDAFTTYYNQQQSTSYTYNQIDSIYRRYGLVTGVCQSNTLTLCGRSAPVFPPVTLKPYSPCDDSTNFIMAAATIRYQAWADSVKGAFNDAYLAKCLNAYKNESFTVTQPMSEFHYTLYYYDQAGNLLRTVPPEGIDMTAFRPGFIDSVNLYRSLGQILQPQHGLKTDYRYNTLNQVVVQSTPDAGQSKFWYDRLGRLVFGQNLKQKNASTTEDNRQYSYTTYDYLGRISEVGQLNNKATNGAMGDNISRNDSLRNAWLLALTNRKEQVTRTYYDLAYPYTNTIPLTARNLRNRVAYTTITNDYSTTNFNAATFYSYDIHGNVDTLLQDYGASTSELTKNIMNRNGNRWARMVYQYDLISGKVNHVAFNPPYFDVTTQAYVMPKTSFYHRYSYDAENRLTMVETSRDSVFWQKDARYEYYKHGPLARVVIGDQQVQGLDYAYTIQGWLKGVNSTAATSTQDMGGDGLIGGQNVNVARDVFGFSLNYFGGDYSPINSIVNPFPNTSGPLTTKAAYRPLYNGNISSMAVNIKPFNQPFLYNYKYDQLNRLTAMDAFTGLDTAANNWTAITATKSYNERVSYDGNGNIKTYNRYFDVTSTPMDSLSYNYIANSNKLSSVTDKSQGWVNVNYKLKNQAANNYAYDDIGNLIKDSSEYIPTGGIKWNVYGKIAEINHSQAGVTFSTRRINYFYDAAGNRIGKKVVKFGSANVAWTWYVRDAQGNVMGVYTAAKDTVATDTTLSPFQLLIAEHHIYGSSRLGISNVTGQDAETNLSTAPGNLTITRGERFYELSNHLGNVLAVISDKKMGHTSNNSSLDYYNPDIVSVTDYYPFGMVSRSAYLNNLNLNYRYSFNGKENDKDVKGDGNQIDYGARIYDPRVGKFLSVDPLSRAYPMLTPYQYASNDPIESVDADGLERVDFRLTKNDNGQTALAYIGTERTREEKVYFRDFPVWTKTVAVPSYIRVEYNGQHYNFADNGPNSKVASTLYNGLIEFPASDGVHYSKDFDAFVANPDGIIQSQNFLSEEQAYKAEYFRETKVNLGIELVGGVGAMAATSMLSKNTTTSSGTNQAAAANNGSNEPSKANNTNTTANTNRPVQAWEVGEFSDLQKRSTKGDGLDLHHAPQKQPAAQVIPGYNWRIGTTIAIPEDIHEQIPTLKGPYSGTPRQLLAQDVKKIRAAGAPGNAVKAVVDHAKQQHPNSYKKPIRNK